jgi:drug/metabolite transporter (DMT)-like permease
VVLAEPISAMRWLGIALIAGGIAIVGWSQP